MCSTNINKIVLWTGLLMAMTSATYAADWYVDSTGSPGGTGSLASPYRTIQDGLNSLAPGDTLWLRGEIYGSNGRKYTETISLPIHGTEPQPITVRAFSNEVVIVHGTSTAQALLSVNKNYWIFQDLIFDQNQIYFDAIRIEGHHITFKSVEVRNGQREGIDLRQNAHTVVIQDSYIHDFMKLNPRQDAHCILLETDVNPNIDNVKIYRNTIERCSGDGVQIFGQQGDPISQYATNIEIVGNTFLDGTQPGSGQTENALDFKAGDTVLVKDNTMRGYTNNKTIVVQHGCQNITIEGNRISDGDRGIEMRQEGGMAFIQHNGSIKNNLIYDMTSYALKFDGVKDITVANNTLVNIRGNSLLFEGLSANGGMIKNNLVYQSGPTQVKAAFSNLVIENNGWFQSNAGALAQASDTTGRNPLFVDETTDDYRLQALSPAVNSGVDVGTTYFESSPDLGAFEYKPEKEATTPNRPTCLNFT